MADMQTTVLAPLFQSLPAISGQAHAPAMQLHRVDRDNAVLVIGLAVIVGTGSLCDALREAADALEAASAGLRSRAATASA